jgi:hypothetical protein
VSECGAEFGNVGRDDVRFAATLHLVSEAYSRVALILSLLHGAVCGSREAQPRMFGYELPTAVGIGPKLRMPSVEKMLILRWALFLLPLGIGAANASNCLVGGPPYQLRSDTVEWQMSTRVGETCRRGVRFKLISNPTIKVISSPHFGNLTLQGPSFSYTAGLDFHDQDSFTIEVSGFVGKANGSSTIHVTVSNFAAAIPPRPAPHLPPAAPASNLAPTPGALENATPPDGSLPACPVWDWSKSAPPPMRPPFDQSKLYCPPPPFNPPNPPVGCVCSQ